MEYIFDCCKQQLKRKKNTLKNSIWGSFNKKKILERMKLLQMSSFLEKKMLILKYIFSCILWWGL